MLFIVCLRFTAGGRRINYHDVVDSLFTGRCGRSVNRLPRCCALRVVAKQAILLLSTFSPCLVLSVNHRLNRYDAACVLHGSLLVLSVRMAYRCYV